MAGPVGVSIIVKNGIDTLPHLLDDLERVRGIDGVFVFDTGSTDGTWEYLQTFQDTSYLPLVSRQIEWSGRFDDARNAAMVPLIDARFEWMLWLDADDRIPDLNALSEFLDNLDQYPDVDAFHVPYEYVVDEFDNPIIVQRRERLVRTPMKWYWRNPVHEVLEYVGGREAVFQDTDAFVVRHKPVRTEGYNDRNWKILLDHYFSTDEDEISPFMWFYIMREAYTRGEHMFAHNVALRLKHCDIALPFQKYEALLIIARVRAAAGASPYEVHRLYGQAIRLIPELNEARSELLNYLLEHNELALAQQTVMQLNDEAPNTVGVVDKSLYGSYPHFAKALVDAKSQQNVGVVLHDFLKGLEFDYVHPIGLVVDAWLRRKIQQERIGVIYADLEYYTVARNFGEKLEKADVFAEVYTFTNPLCANYANDIHFHFGGRDSLHKEETSPYCRKVLVCADTLTSHETFGWTQAFIGMDITDETLMQLIFEKVFSPYEVVTAPTIEQGLNRVKESDAKFMLILREGVVISEELMGYVLEMFEEFPNDIFSIGDGPTIGLGGKRERLVALAAREDTLMRYAIDKVILHFGDEDEPEFELEETVRNPQKTVYIYAEGVEPWDGCTPYSRGIGASEASVVYLAEQMMLNHNVVVFCPVPTLRVVGEVTYAPLTEFGNYPTPDVLISSRCPHLLTKRIAKTQILWLHDLYQHTVFPDTCVFDRLVCVSRQEQNKASKDWGHKTTVIPNPYKPNTLPNQAIDGRCVWLSSPDRGVVNLLQSEVATQDLWVTYSYFNAKVMRANDPVQFQAIWQEKHKLRRAGVRLVGRLGLSELRRLLSTCEFWPYASTFEETFCVAALEAVGAGVHPIYTCNGAVMSTINKYTDGAFYDLYGPDDVLDTLEEAVGRSFLGGTVYSEVFPENVCEMWERILQ